MQAPGCAASVVTAQAPGCAGSGMCSFGSYSAGSGMCSFGSYSMCVSVIQLTGLVALQHAESSWPRDQTRVPCIGR